MNETVYSLRHFTQFKNRILSKIVDHNNVTVNYGTFLLQDTFVFNFLKAEVENVPGVTDIFGHPAEKFSFYYFLDIIHPDDFTFVYSSFKKALKIVFDSEDVDSKLSLSFTASFRVRNNKGEYIHILNKVRAIELVDGVVSRALNVCSDISALNLRPFVSVDFKFGNNPGFSENNFDAKYAPDYISLFSKREMAVLRLIAVGMKSIEIADDLGISIKTVNTHRRNILGKADGHNIIEIITLLKEVKMI